MRERELGEEVTGVIAKLLDRLGDLVRRLAVRDSTGRDEAFGVARELLDPIVADAEAEILRRDVLELMRFVDDRGCTRG